MTPESVFPYLFIWIWTSLIVAATVDYEREKFTTKGLVVLGLIFLPATVFGLLLVVFVRLLRFIAPFFLKEEVLEEKEDDDSDA